MTVHPFGVTLADVLDVMADADEPTGPHCTVEHQGGRCTFDPGHADTTDGVDWHLTADGRAF